MMGTILVPTEDLKKSKNFTSSSRSKSEFKMLRRRRQQERQKALGF